ncbi:hypothetical protein NBRC116583_19950 [Arenicella sp. 4NH20-0111]|uniref:serine aminopeptidase domain-containing protein n=1 Tax=Arenicella sp. 4NH20-0111 TaxID=3127648 RepID=UPI00310AB6EC
MNIIKRGLIVLLISLLAIWGVAFIKVNYVGHAYAPVSDGQLAEAKAYLSSQMTPTPDDFQWSMIETAPGVSLRTGLLEHPNPKGTVIVVPGFTGAIEMIMREISMIHAAGYRVASIEYRGQGMSYRPLKNHPEKGYVEDYNTLGSELALFAKKVKQKRSPLFFFSISKGAHITMRMAAEQAVDVTAFALIVPMIKINSGEFPYENLRTISSMMTKVGLGAAYSPGGSAWPGDEMVFGEATDCNANPDSAQAQSALFAINEKLRTKSVTYKWLYETTNSTEKLLSSEFIAQIKQPVKIYTAGIDSLVSTDAAEKFCDSLAQCEAVHYPSSRHCITRENYELYDGIINDAISHFDHHAE